jgi:predicted DNA-binding protein (UPF0251 family)
MAERTSTGVPQPRQKKRLERQKAVAAKLVDAEEIYRLKVKGLSTQQIAEAMGISAKEVANAVNTRLKIELSMITSEDREGMLKLEMDRYDALQAAHWDMAMAGDPASSNIVIKVFAERAKRLQMDALDPTTQHQTILVVAGSEQEYIKSLQEADDDES